MTPEQWAEKNGILERRWAAAMDRYHWLLNTGHVITIDGEEVWRMSKYLAGPSAEHRLAMLVRDRWLELQLRHFEDAHARGGYC